MANANPPRRVCRIPAAEIQVAARVNREVLEGAELLGGEVDREPLRDGAQVEEERTRQRDRVGSDAHVAIGAGSGINEGPNNRARPVLPIEPQGLHSGAERGIEGAAAGLRDRQRKFDRRAKKRADADRVPGLSGQLVQFARRIETAADAFDLEKPVEGPLQRLVGAGRPDLHGGITDDLNRDDSAEDCSSALMACHLAFPSASTTAK